MTGVLWTLLAEMASAFGTRVICSRNVSKPQCIWSLRCSNLFNGGKRLTDTTNLEITQLSETSQSQNCDPAPLRSSCKHTVTIPSSHGTVLRKIQQLLYKQKGCKEGQRQVTTGTRSQRPAMCTACRGLNL